MRGTRALGANSDRKTAHTRVWVYLNAGTPNLADSTAGYRCGSGFGSFGIGCSCDGFFPAQLLLQFRQGSKCIYALRYRNSPLDVCLSET